MVKTTSEAILQEQIKNRGYWKIHSHEVLKTVTVDAAKEYGIAVFNSTHICCCKLMKTKKVDKMKLDNYIQKVRVASRDAWRLKT